MKYELNTPYTLNVKNVVQDDNNIVFEVEIGDYQFPVKAFPEQLEEGTPSTVSCRIIQDKNKDAYLVQNELFYYPLIYKPNRKYIFEIVDIKNNYIILQDKYGLFHTMNNDGNHYVINEIILRYVDIVKDNDYKAHLSFYSEKPVVNSIIEEPAAESTPPEHHQYAPTIFEQDPPKNGNIITQNVVEKYNNDVINRQNGSERLQTSEKSVSSMIVSNDWKGLKLYLNNNLSGSQIKNIQNEVATTISSLPSRYAYWESILFFLNYDARIFLGTIASIDVSKIPGITNNVIPNVVDKIINAAFSEPDKTKYALTIIKPYKDILTTSQKNYILGKCESLNSDEAFYDLFKILKQSPEDAVPYLLSLKTNVAAAYTLFKLLSDGKNGNLIDENSPFRTFRPSTIMLIVGMIERNDSSPFSAAAKLINYNILSKGTCPTELLNEVAQNGLDGFKQYLVRKERKKNARMIVESLSRGDLLEGLTYATEIDNYYLLIHQQTNEYALLIKEQTVTIPNRDCKSDARIVKKIVYNNRTYFIVSQKKLPSMYVFPPLVNQSTILNIGFTQGKDGHWVPEVKNYSKIINVVIDSRPRYLDYKTRHKAKISRKIDFFTYGIIVL